VHGQHQVGLLDHLFAIEVEVRVVEQQRVVLGRSAREVPLLIAGEALHLRVHAELVVVGKVHGGGRAPPGRGLLVVDAQPPGPLGVPVDRVGRGDQVPLRHQVGVDVVVLDGGVFVGAGDPVDVEPAVPVVVAQRAPQPGGLDQDLEADVALEVVVAGRGHVSPDGVGDVGVDVERGGAGRPVGRALLPADRAPREGGAAQAELLGTVTGQVEGGVPPPQRAGHGLGQGVRQHGQREHLGVPEDVAVVPGPGQALGRDRSQLGAGAGLQDVEQPEPDGLLDLLVAFDPHVRGVPELVEVVPLLPAQAFPAGELRGRQRPADLIADRRQRTPAGPAVGQQLDHRQLLAGLQDAGDRGAGPVAVRFGAHVGLGRPVDLVAHRGAQPKPAALGARDQLGAGVVEEPLLDLQRLGEHGGDPRVLALRRQRLVGDQLGLHDQAQRLVDRLDLVPDRGDRALGERDQAGAVYADPPPGRRLPLQLAVEGAGAEVEHPGVRDQFAVADVEGLVVDQQPDRLAVGHVDDGLPRLGEAVARLGVGQRAQLVERVEVGARDAVRLALVEVAAQADVPVAEREDGLGLREDLEVEAGLADMPRLDRVRALADHESSSLRSRTTTVAPLSLRPCA
jgi:hypothetical protein